MRRAKAHFEQGEIAAARDVFESEHEQMQDENDRLVSEKTRYEQDVLPQLKHSSEEFYVRALLERTAYDNANWLADTCKYFERSISAFATEDNVFGYALFLQNHNHLDQAASLYQQYMDSFAREDQPKRAATLNNLAVLHSHKNKLAEAEVEYVEALEIRRKLAAVNPSAYLPDVAMTLTNVAIFHLQFALDREHSIKCAMEAVMILLPIVENVPYTQKELQTAISVLQGWGLNSEDIQRMLV